MSCKGSSEALIEAYSCNISLTEERERGVKPNLMSKVDWVQALDSDEICEG